MERDQLRRLQIKRLKALLNFAYEHVPYYHRVFKAAGVKPCTVNCLEDLQRVPILTRAVMDKQLDDLVLSNYRGRGLFSWCTSGTTATPARFYRTKTDLSWQLAAELRNYKWAGYETGDKLAMIWAVHEAGFKYELRNLLKRAQTLDVKTISEPTMEAFARKMHRFQPAFIRGYAGSTNLFATYLEQHQQFRIHPRAVFTSAQTLRPHYRKNIEQTFECDVYDCYGTNEVSFVAGQCAALDGLHIAEENMVVEVMKDGEPAAPGEEGHVLLTNLHNFAMPFIRYDVGDMGTLYPDGCSCGRQLRLFKPEGRVYEYFWTGDGTFTFLKDFQTFFQDIPVQDFQVVQEAVGRITVRIAPKPGYSDAHTAFIVKNIKLRGPADIHVEVVDSILPGRSGKIQHVVSKLPTTYT